MRLDHLNMWTPKTARSMWVYKQAYTYLNFSHLIGTLASKHPSESFIYPTAFISTHCDSALVMCLEKGRLLLYDHLHRTVDKKSVCQINLALWVSSVPLVLPQVICLFLVFINLHALLEKNLHLRNSPEARFHRLGTITCHLFSRRYCSGFTLFAEVFDATKRQYAA